MEIVLTAVGIAAAAVTAAGLLVKPGSVYKNRPNDRNPLEGKKVRFVEDPKDHENADGVRGHLEAESNVQTGRRSFYDRLWKRLIDVLLSLLAMMILSPVFVIISLAVFIDDPGPVIFSQKRIGRDLRYFRLHKFRSMKMDTPYDVPTHMLDNPERYITRLGRFLRKSSLDELPQLFDIFIGNMSFIGPRPALWNQDLLTAERDRYGANGIRPGLSGWAQINGRDRVHIADKARLDGEYAERLRRGGIRAFFFDLRCMAVTMFSFLKSDGVAEGTYRKDTNIQYVQDLKSNNSVSHNNPGEENE